MSLKANMEGGYIEEHILKEKTRVMSLSKTSESCRALDII